MYAKVNGVRFSLQSFHIHEKDSSEKVWSVKVGDTEYTVGDKVIAPATHTGSKVLTITGFRINEANNNMLVLCKEFSKNGIGIENIQKAPVVTEWEPVIGDYVYVTNGHNWIQTGSVIQLSGFDGRYWYNKSADPYYNGKTRNWYVSKTSMRKATVEEIKAVNEHVERFAVMLTAADIKTLKEIIKKQS